jgi:hypothetical protein
VKAGKVATGKKAPTVRKGRSVAGMAAQSKSAKPSKSARPVKPGKLVKPVAADKPVGRVVVRELDPQQKCGEGTSVQFLYRVDHTVDGHRTAHLVFFDPHGWYCEHGRTCPAVAHAKKHNGQFARVS